MKKIALYTSFYHAKDEVRNKEMLFCLEQNIKCKSIDRIFVFNESSRLPKHNKITAVTFNRPKYNDFFKWANECGYDYSVISNSDIFFDDSLDLLSKMADNHAYALSKYEHPSNKLCNIPHGSQDTWIFKGQIKPIRGGFELGGVPGCDNRIAYEMQKAGYKVLNPCKSIKAYHNHRSGIRYYDRKYVIQPPYINVAPCRL